MYKRKHLRAFETSFIEFHRTTFRQSMKFFVRTKMSVLTVGCLGLVFLCCVTSISAQEKITKYRQGNDTDEAAGTAFLKVYNQEASEECHQLVMAEWNYATNLTDYNKKQLVEKRLENAKYLRAAWKNTTSYAWKNFSDPQIKRQFKLMSILGSAALPEDKLSKYENLSTTMESIYGKAKICPYSANKTASNSSAENCSLSLEPDLSRIMTKSQDYDELLYIWTEWRNAAGKPNRENFINFLDLTNEMARLNGFKDTADYWLAKYEDDHIEEDFEKLWEQVKPLYEQLHAYVRRKLIERFGGDKIKADGPIPAHILGNMWAQTWSDTYNFTAPYPERPSMDVTSNMVEQGYTPQKMFHMADEFFTSLGLEPMPQEFWNNSVIEKPKDRELICHASAWDFCKKPDVRIKQCTDINMMFLEVTHHEMGHIQYYLQYKDQPISFREGANPGFHEAVGDLMALSVVTPAHLTQVGLRKIGQEDKENDINYLFSCALKKIAFLPFGYLIDRWRWKVFRGEFTKDEFNKRWWEMRLKYQGVIPPVPRSEDDFDPAAKYHIAANVEYSRYFIAAILQFQFHKTLCNLSNHEGPLHHCDIYKSKEAGERLGNVLKLGSSKPWPEVLGIMTDGAQTRMDASALMEYFEPLYEWLKNANKNETVGWKTDN